MNIKLKWNKLTYDIEAPSDVQVVDLKRKISELTGVPVDRQKLMAKGAWTGTLKVIFCNFIIINMYYLYY